jgi:hypothetical protein
VARNIEIIPYSWAAEIASTTAERCLHRRAVAATLQRQNDRWRTAVERVKGIAADLVLPAMMAMTAALK